MKTNKKLIIIISIVVLGLAGASTVVFVFKGGAKSKVTPDPASQSDAQMREYVQSEQFKNLAEQDRRQYMRSAMGQRMTSQAQKYNGLPAEQRTAYLDEVIDSMQAWREQMPRPARRRDANDPNFRADRRQRGEQGNGQGGPQGQGQRRQMEPSQMRARMESMDPARAVQMQAFREALRKRMQERGIQGPQGGRGGGRPGGQ
jgi:hypothetical protein